jgi:CcmD family protein
MRIGALAAAGLLIGLWLQFSAAHVVTAAEQQPSQQDQFVPIDQLPPEEQLPAAPMLVAAYAFVWVAVLAYCWSIWRRLARVERDIVDLSRRFEERGRRT